jgi:hypothetical protein
MGSSPLALLLLLLDLSTCKVADPHSSNPDQIRIFETTTKFRYGLRLKTEAFL